MSSGFSGTLGLEVHAGAICDQDATPLDDTATIPDNETYTITITLPTLFWPADTSGNFITGSWRLANGTPSSWVDGSPIVVGSGGASVSPVP